MRASVVSGAGLAALAVAMGIGRFAFTPILPMMQDDAGLTLAQGGWLASANYAGYLAGALYAMRARLRPGRAIAWGLAAISIATLAAAFASGMASLVVLRFVPGFASALVLVFVSAWSMDALRAARRPGLAGIVFAGVGVGIVFTGLACLQLARMHASSATAWSVLGLAGLLVSAFVGPAVRHAQAAVPAPRGGAERESLRRHWRLVFAHGAFGFGYIIPATFIPVMARSAIADPAMFGWAWPAFGAAAAISTLVSARLGARVHPRRLWSLGLVVMALGVACPIAFPSLAGIIVAALAVGGTFMVGTMLGMQEATRVAGPHARVLMAAMTAAFAVGQIVGPVLAGVLVHLHGGFSLALAIAALPLVLAAFLLNTGAAAVAAAPASTRHLEKT